MTRMLGRYELVRPLGRGGMADVYLALRRAPGGVEKRLVVKCIRRERVGDPRFVEMFVQEARLSMALTHRNIVPVFDFGRVDDELFLVMDYVHGVDLGGLLANQRERGERFDPELAAYVAMEACEALDYAHHVHGDSDSSTGIVHRDVTPRNVLLSTMGEVKLADFGVAAAIAELEQGGRVRGTPAYMAPEQARAGVVDKRADLFSLGLVLWEALAGQRAYPGKDPSELLHKARAAQVPPLPDHVPDKLRAIVQCATTSDPDERYADARAMQIALDGFLVTARAQTGARPPSHRLASLVQDITGPLGMSDIRVSGGTERSSGIRALESPNDRLGASTLRSMAATMGDESMVNNALEPDTADPTEPADSSTPGMEPSARDALLAAEHETTEGREHTNTPARTGHRRTAAIGAGAVMVAAMVIAAVWFARTRANLESADVRNDVAPGAGLTADSTPTTDPTADDRDAYTSPDHDSLPADISRLSSSSSSATAAVAAAAAELAPVALERIPIPDDPPAAPITRTFKHHKSMREPAAIPSEDRALGTLKISATPWAEVTIQEHDASCPETPCVLHLPQGQYLLHLVNPVAKLQKDIPVSITRDQTVIINTSLLAQ